MFTISEEQINLLNNDIQFLKGVLSRVVSEKLNSEKDIVESKNWIAKQPTYLMFLQNLQNALHQKNLGAFSQLLSYFVKDVLGKEKDIVFDLYTFRNLPALKIESLNDGCREDIYEGNGGSIANIVSTGLRLIVLSRLRNRKFIVLDEPDCWLKPDHVSSFAKIIGEISEKLKIQTVIISHHDWQYFKDYGRVVRLANDGKNLYAEIIHDTPAVHDLDSICDIRLRHYMSHEDTTFELHPYLTCIVGENDIGKSVLSSAIRAVCYGESSDSVIKHHTNEAQVLFSLANNKNVLWQRFRTTSLDNPQKVKFSLFEGNELVNAEFNSSDTPDFISNVLNIIKIEDLDVQVGNQKQPVFLLSNDIKPNERAKILSLGKESILIQKMMETIKQKSRNYTSKLKEAEQSYEKLSKIANTLSNIEDVESLSLNLKITFNEINANCNNVKEFEDFINKYSEVSDLALTENLKVISDTPRTINTDLLQEYVASLGYNEVVSNIDKISCFNQPINLSNTSDIERAIHRLSMSLSGATIPKVGCFTTEPKCVSINELSTIIFEIDKFTSITNIDIISNLNNESYKVNNNSDDLDSIINDLVSISSQISSLHFEVDSALKMKKELEITLENYLETNDICPTCNQKINYNLLKGNISEKD